jgi:hypothetical protein
MLIPISAIKVQAATRSIPGPVTQRASAAPCWFLAKDLFPTLPEHRDLIDQEPPRYQQALQEKVTVMPLDACQRQTKLWNLRSKMMNLEK